MPSTPTPSRFLPTAELQSLINALAGRGYEVIGPTIEQEAIVYGPIASIDDLPRGWSDAQEPGKYRLARRDDDALFGYVVGPFSWKRFLFPPSATVATADRTADGWRMGSPSDKPPKYAFLGVRACELAALDVQDRVFLNGPYVDPIYRARREQALIVAVNCTQAASTCFCGGLSIEQMWVSLERNMQCAVGLCGHCQLGPEFICKDGPVFRYDRVERWMGVEAF